jgi:hypothetical protein
MADFSASIQGDWTRLVGGFALVVLAALLL